MASNLLRRVLALAGIAGALLAQPAYGAPITFFGLDANPNDPSPPVSRANADGARDSFLAGLDPGTIGFQSFETFSQVVTFAPLGVTATLSGPFSFGSGIHPGGLFPISGVQYVQSFAPLSTPRQFLTISFSSRKWHSASMASTLKTFSVFPIQGARFRRG